MKNLKLRWKETSAKCFECKVDEPQKVVYGKIAEGNGTYSIGYLNQERNWKASDEKYSVVLQLEAEELIMSEIGKMTAGNFQVAAERTGSHPHGSVGICGFLCRTEMSKSSWSSAAWIPIT